MMKSKTTFRLKPGMDVREAKRLAKQRLQDYTVKTAARQWDKWEQWEDDFILSGRASASVCALKLQRSFSAVRNRLHRLRAEQRRDAK